jgi:hypothetical protein
VREDVGILQLGVLINQAGGVLELYSTNGKKSPIWLASFGKEMKWGP